MAAPQDDVDRRGPPVASDPAETRPAQVTAPPAEQPPPPTPDYIAQVFIVTYYEVFCKRPEHLYRFYKDESVYSHSSGPDEDSPKHCVTGLSSINEIIKSHGSQQYLSKIFSIDSQEAPDGSVMISVTGSLTSKLGVDTPRQFVQAFLLCPQENGYFVRNDIFRFLDAPPATPAVSAPPSIQTQETTPIPSPAQVPAPGPAPKPAAAPLENGEQAAYRAPCDDTTISVVSDVVPTENSQGNSSAPALDLDKQAELGVDEVAEASSSVSPSTDTPQSEDIVPADVEANMAAEDPASVAPKSWASLFNGRAPDGKEPTEGQDPTPPTPETDGATAQPVELAADVPHDQQGTAPRQHTNGPGHHHHHHHDHHRSNEQGVVTVPPSVWVSQLPTNVQLSELEVMMREEFAKYGKVKNVDCRVQRGFAFVDMDSWESVGVAVDAWASQPAPISGPFKGVKLNVQIRKQPPLKGPGRGMARTHSGSGRGGGGVATRGGRGGGSMADERRPASSNRSGRVSRPANGTGSARAEGGQQHRGTKGRSQVAE